MRRTLTAMLTGSLVLAATVVVVGQSASVPPTNDATVEPILGREEAVALVRVMDPRFAVLPDYDDLEKEVAASFSFEPLLASGYVRVLPTLQNDLADLGAVRFRYPAGWLIETTLVTGCADLPADGTVVADPCAWRHTWIHHVTAHGDVVTLTESGDPELAPGVDDLEP
jgi:hypothetical protein